MNKDREKKQFVKIGGEDKDFTTDLSDMEKDAKCLL